MEPEIMPPLAQGDAFALGSKSAIPAAADEGLWPVDEFLIDRINERFGIDLSKAWLKHVRGAAVLL